MKRRSFIGLALEAATIPLLAACARSATTTTPTTTTTPDPALTFDPTAFTQETTTSGEENTVEYNQWKGVVYVKIQSTPNTNA